MPTIEIFIINNLNDVHFSDNINFIYLVLIYDEINLIQQNVILVVHVDMVVTSYPSTFNHSNFEDDELDKIPNVEPN